MGIPIFLSRAAPHLVPQQEFLDDLCGYLNSRGIEPRTVGETDFFGVSGLEAIRSVMMQSYGLVSVAFRRLLIRDGADRPGADKEFRSVQQLEVKPNTWLTTPYCHIESAMAYQIGLPILIVVEKDVRMDGALEAGVLAQYPPEFDLDCGPATMRAFFSDNLKWKQLVSTWEGQVREVARNRARPPTLFGR